MLKSGSIKVIVDGGDVNSSSTDSRHNFKRLYFEDIKDYYSFKLWLKDNLMMYDSGAGDYEEPLHEHILVFLVYLRGILEGDISRPHWYKRLGSIARYAIKLEGVKDE